MASAKGPAPPAFDIRPRMGFYVGSEWHPRLGRYAHLYAFAYHPIANATANHLDPRQWVFHVVSAESLPPNKRIGLARVRSVAPDMPWHLRLATVDQLRRGGRRDGWP